MELRELGFDAILTLEAADKILKFDHSNGSYWAVLCFRVVYYTMDPAFESVDEILWCDHSNESY